MTTIEKAILKTIIYADIFDFPLKKEEIWRFIISKQMSYSEFDSSLTNLIKQKKIIFKRKFYALFFRVKLIKIRLERKQYIPEKIRIARKAAVLAKLIPTIWFIGISGALAMGNAPAEDDIDWFIITAPHTLWFTRLCLTLILDLFNLRRKPGRYTWQNKICLNMYLDADKLTMPKSNQNLFVAHEIVQVKPLFNRFHTYENFLQANKWLKKIMPHGRIEKDLSIQSQVPGYIKSGLFKYIEKICQKFQQKFMQRRKTYEHINSDLLKFHPLDAQVWVNLAYRERLKKWGLTKGRGVI